MILLSVPILLVHQQVLEIIKVVGQLRRWVLVEVVTNQEGKFVGILAHSRYPDSSSPVEVNVAEFEGYLLQMIWLYVGGEFQDVVVSWGNCTLTNRLWDQEEVKQSITGYFGVNNGSRVRV